jgi:hypothetical protein
MEFYLTSDVNGTFVRTKRAVYFHLYATAASHQYNTNQRQRPYSPDGELRVAKAVCFGSTTNAACSADSQGNADGTHTVSFEYTTTVADVGLSFAPLIPAGLEYGVQFPETSSSYTINDMPATPVFTLPIAGYSAAMCPSGYEVRLSSYYFVSTA